MPSALRRAGAALWSQPYLLLVLTTLLWAGNAVASRLAVGEIGPMTLTSLRWVVVAGFLVPLLRHDLVRHLPALLPRWRLIVPMGCLGFTVFNAMMYVAAYSTSAINIGIVQGSMPILVLIGAFLAYRTPIGLVQVAGVLVTMLGILVVAAQGDPSVLRTFAFNPGDVVMIVACLFYSGYTVGLRNRPAMPGLVFFAAMAFIACLTSLPLLVYENVAGPTGWPTMKGWLVLLFVAIGPSLLSQLFFIRSVEMIGPGRAGIFVNLVPVFSPMLAIVILNEPFHWYHAAALVLVLGGIWLAERSRSA